MGFVKQVGQGLGLIGPDGPSAQETLDMQTKANNQQQQTNLQQNRVNQVGPGGSSTWTQGPAGADGSPGTWTQTTSLDPEQQKIFDSQTRLSQGMGAASEAGLARATDAMGRSLDLSGMPARQGMPTYQAHSAAQAGENRAIRDTFDTSGVRKLPGEIDDTSRRRVEEALMSRLNPQYANDESALRTRLLNSGIEVGTDAYNKEMNNFSQRLNDARMQAVLAGGQEENRQVGLTQGLNAQEFGQAESMGNFGQKADTTMAANDLQRNIVNAQLAQQQAQLNFQNQLSTQGFNNSTRDSGISEQKLLHDMPLNDLNALRTGAQVVSPTFANYYTNGMNPGNAQDAANAELGQANKQSGQLGNFLGVGNYLGMKGF